MFSSFILCVCFPDLLLIFYYWKAIGDKFFVVHHLAALYAYYYVLVSALLSNSRTCRQDGKDTTKGEQLSPLSVIVLTHLNTRMSIKVPMSLIYYRLHEYMQDQIRIHVLWIYTAKEPY